MRIFVVDAFTDRPFSGNPAGVCLFEEPPTDSARLQRIAAEFNLPATAFVYADQLRWFSPTTELELCGHGTLSTAHVLGELGTSGPMTFHTMCNVVTAERGPDGEIGLDFPADPTRPIEPLPELVKALGFAPVAAAQGGMDTLAELDSARAVRDLTPDYAAVLALGGRGLIVTAPGDTDGVDFVSRFFAPARGTQEDSVTGSAHCTLGPYWAEKLGRTTLRGNQVSARGGRVGVEVRGDRVRLAGRAVTVMRGELYD
jgi:PhzF family phenazine biosynthesis protein